MYPRYVVALLLILSGICFSQDTNFPSGPQYLITTSSPMILRPIATPSLSLSETRPIPTVSTTEQGLAQEAPAPSAVTNQTFLSDVYWGNHSAGEVQARRVSTPNVSPSEVAMNIGVGALEATPVATEALPGLPVQPASSVIEVSSAALPANLPPSIFDTGVTALTSAQALRERGYGLPVGDVAAYWKVNKPTVVRVFTNQDVQRLHGTS